MHYFEQLVATLEELIWNTPEAFPALVAILVGYGIFITFRLGFIQIRRFSHGLKVVSGAFDDPDEKGDLNHFQALSTALSATVGIGNIAGVALAIHVGGPGALFWMWVTAALGMAIKFSEVTLAHHFRRINPDGSISGGPMYYIENGMGPRWKWLAVTFAVAMGITGFLTGNAIQANTIADILRSDFQIPVALTGAVSATLVAAVILGGIRRIGYVTARLVPIMAFLYVGSGLIILLLNITHLPSAFATIFSHAFNPKAGVLGVGSGALITTLSYGIQRGLYSNESGLGTAPIAHAAARTDEPVREGVVALLEPFIDTLLICTITGLVIVQTGAWDMYHKTAIDPASGTVSYRLDDSAGSSTLRFEEGVPLNGVMMRYGIPVDSLYADASLSILFTGAIEGIGSGAVTAQTESGRRQTRLYGGVVETGAPLTAKAFEIGLSPLLPGGGFIVTLSVILFAISTSISWSYYGDRAADYLFGSRSVPFYRIAYVLMHFFGAVVALTTVWAFGDVMMGMMACLNIFALFALSGVVVRLTRAYFRNPGNHVRKR